MLVERAVRMVGDAGTATDEAAVPESWTDIIATQLTVMYAEMGRQFADLLKAQPDKLSASIRDQIEHGQRITPEAEQAARSRKVVTVEPVIGERDGGKVLIIPAEAGYGLTEEGIREVMG